MKKFLVVILLSLFVNKAHALPSRYDLRDYGKITSVRNQGIPGPCWAFAALGSCESNYLMQNLHTNGKIPNLSEMQTAYYSYKDLRPERNFTSKYKSGTLSLEGNVFMVTAFLSRLSGPARESDLKYSTININAVKNSAKKFPEDYKRAMRLRDVYFLSHSSEPSDELRKTLIINHGAIAISFYSEVSKYHTHGKFYTYFNNSHGHDVNHVVLIAGWDDNFSRDNFSPRPSKNGAWLVKNSWGTLRGNNNGYFWMPYEQYIYGGAAFIVEKDNPRLKHYGYDDLGYCGSVNYSWAANVFRISGAREFVSETSFYTPYNNMNYELYIHSSGKDFPLYPVSGKLITSVNGVIDIAGYHTIKLPEKIAVSDGEYISAVLKLDKNVMPVERVYKNYSENARVNQHESYFSRDGKTWIDGVDINSNACIKIFTDTRSF